MARGKRTTYKKVQYASKFEAEVAKKLARRKNVNVEYETEQLPYVLYKNYEPDFVVTLEDGTKFYIEAKGHFDRDARSKMIAVKEQHPDKDIRLVFESDNYLYRGAKWRYSDWAERNGFMYSIQDVPKDWFLPKEKESK